MTARKRHIGLVTLVVKDYDEAKAWYRDVLGFVELEDTPQPDGKRWVVVAPSEGAGTGLLLACPRVKSVAPIPPSPLAHQWNQ